MYIYVYAYLYMDIHIWIFPCIYNDKRVVHPTTSNEMVSYITFILTLFSLFSCSFCNLKSVIYVSIHIYMHIYI
jgi:hypothetical protein